MQDIKKYISSDAQKKLKKISQPVWIAPMLATLTKKYFSSPDWIYEHKLDGQRILVWRNGSLVKLLSRNKVNNNAAYPELVEAFLKQKSEHFIIDGEIVAFKNGVSNFETLQKRFGIRNETEARILAKQIPIAIYIFDVLYANGYQVTALPLEERKKILKKLLQFKDPVRHLPFVRQKGEELFKQACKNKWEGVIAKRFSAPYHVGRRSTDWLKFKCVANQELVIAGYTDPSGSRTGFGALLLGFYKNGKLHYAGKVGTGFNEDTLQELTAKMKRIEQKKCPFVNPDEIPSRGVHWIKPVLVGEFGFEEWTRDNRLRHGRFQGLRYDKKAKDVVKEEPKG
jgi:DNA ligase D-like protein (predicted ligase)